MRDHSQEVSKRSAARPNKSIIAAPVSSETLLVKWAKYEITKEWNTVLENDLATLLEVFPNSLMPSYHPLTTLNFQANTLNEPF
ncbi:hypothetical protein RUND412_000554 [Rhizina undulata]